MDQTLVNGLSHCGSTAGNVKLLKHTLDVGLHRPFSNPKFVPDDLIALAFRDQFENFDLPSCQFRAVHFFDQLLANARRDASFATMHSAYRTQQFRTWCVLEQVTASPGLQCLVDILLAFESRQHDYPGLELQRLNLRNHLQPILAGHPEVQEKNIRQVLFDELHGFYTIGSLSD